MKKLPVIILLLALAACSSKNSNTTTTTPVAGTAPADSIIVSMNGIGDIKIGMKKESVEKLLKQKIVLPRLLSDSNVYADTVTCKYNGVDYMIIFMKETQGDTGNTYSIKVHDVGSSSPLLKTRSGISIGDDKNKIVNAYDGYRLDIWPDYDYGKDPPVKSQTKSTIRLYDDSSDKEIIFYMNSNKVETMSVTLYEGD